MTSTSTMPSAKRQRTDTYNSEDDSGDDLFGDFIPDTPAPKWETQPTQIIDRAAPPTTRNHAPSSPSQRPGEDVVQVLASSPAPAPAPPPVIKPALASMMAPAGTTFRAPMVAAAKRAPAFVNLDSDDERSQAAAIVIDSSSEDESGRTTADIKPTLFRTSRTDSTTGNASFHSALQGARYDPNQRGGAGGSFTSSTLQTRPDRAMPVGTSASEESSSRAMRDNVQRLRTIFPQINVMDARKYLVKHGDNLDDAAAAMERDMKAQNQSSAKPQMKRGLEKPVASIKDRYSHKYSTQASPTQTSPQRIQPPPSKRRKLMQGRKHPSSPVTITSSPAKPIQIDSEAEAEAEDETDSGVASESEQDLDLEDRLLKYLNTCAISDLIELTSTTKANAQRLLDSRPFKNLNAARNITDGKALKSGKRSAKAPMGDKIVDVAMDMFSGYEAVDSLVAKCEQLGRPLAEEMKQWGFDVYGAAKSGGELDMTSFDKRESHLDVQNDGRDSGLGSPSSCGAPYDDEDVKLKARKHVFLEKPAKMAASVELKDYQVVGLNWIDMMYRHQLSCMLADDMGLGKTCQIIAFLTHLVETGRPGPHLVVATASTLVNWLQEFQKFAPDLIVEPYHGSQAERFETAERVLSDRSSIQVLVTTYDMTTRKQDCKFLRQMKADVMICDEGHLLKNAMTQKNQALTRIPANFRMILTGTPLQNNLQELATLLAFILPEVFKELEEPLSHIFKHKATTRDADHAALLSAQRISRARSMLTPFVLRRKKHQVLKHLPTKTCRIEYCDLDALQKDIYESFVAAAVERARIRAEGGKMAKTSENNPLMQLRKAAVHPLLFRRHFTDERIEKMADLLRKRHPSDFDPTAKREHLINEMRSFSDYGLHSWCTLYPCIARFDLVENAWLKSGKVDKFVSLVQQYKANGDRVLVFSQFALVLDILEGVLNTAEVLYTRIDGSTRIDERQTLIDQFRDEADTTVFLLTTKAGGTGINLMYANKVIIFDMSFNPQDDVQAENRAHRVGQTRPVEVVRLVSRGTIEESIYRLGMSKLELDGRVAGESVEGEEEGGIREVEDALLKGVKGSGEEVEVGGAKSGAST